MVFFFLNSFLSKGTEMNELLQESLKNTRSPTLAFIKRVFQVRSEIGDSFFYVLVQLFLNCSSIDQTDLFYLELTKLFNKAWDF